MHSKVRPRTAPPPPPPPAPRRRGDIWIGIGLLILGAALAISFDRLTASNAASPNTANASATASADLESSPPASEAELPSESPVDSASPSASSPAAVLEALMPASVNGAALTTETALDTSSLGNTPSSRALAAAVTSLGKKPSDFEIAFAYDPSGSISLTVLGFRLPGVDPATLRTVLLGAWLSSGTPGVTTSSVDLSGTPATRVSYDSGPSEYVLVHKDSVFIIEETDQALAAKAAAAIAAGSTGTSGSPGPSGSVGPSESPSPS